MWIVTDEVMDRLVNGEGMRDIVLIKKRNPKLSIMKLYNGQANYKSYQGFRKYYNSKIQPIIEKVCFFDDNKLFTKILKRFLKLK